MQRGSVGALRLGEGIIRASRGVLEVDLPVAVDSVVGVTFRKGFADIGHTAVFGSSAEERFTRRGVAFRVVGPVRVIQRVGCACFLRAEIAVFGIIQRHIRGVHLRLVVSVAGIIFNEDCEGLCLVLIDVLFHVVEPTRIELHALVGIIISRKVRATLGVCRSRDVVGRLAAAIVPTVGGGVTGARAVILFASVLIGIAEVLTAVLRPGIGEEPIGVAQPVIVDEVAIVCNVPARAGQGNRAALAGVADMAAVNSAAHVIGGVVPGAIVIAPVQRAAVIGPVPDIAVHDDGARGLGEAHFAVVVRVGVREVLVTVPGGIDRRDVEGDDHHHDDGQGNDASDLLFHDAFSFYSENFLELRLIGVDTDMYEKVTFLN